MKRAAATALAMLTLTACGNGGSSTSSADVASPSTSATAAPSPSVTGAAVGVARAAHSILGLDETTAQRLQELVAELSCNPLTDDTRDAKLIDWRCTTASGVVSVQAYATRESALANARGILDARMSVYVADDAPLVIAGKTDADVLAATGGSAAYSRGVLPGAESSTPSAAPEPTDSATPQVPAEYESALTKAQAYSDTMHLSKKGLYRQLTSSSGEGFSAKAATYAVDHVQADWKANALAKAKEYQEDMSMSPSAIRRQLVSPYGEQFTEDEADYAIKHLG